MRNALGYLVTVVAALCWGASGVSADYLMEHHGIELTLISFFRMFVSGILALAYVLARSRGVSDCHRELVSTPRNWRVLVIYAIFGLAACQITYMGAIRESNAGTGTVLQYLGLILIVVWVCLTHRRWPRASEVIAIVLAVSGTFLLCTHGSLDSFVITPTALFTAFLWGVDRIGPVRASLVGCAEPIAATVFSALLMGSSYTGTDIVGMALIVGAVVTISVVDLLRARRVT